MKKLIVAALFLTIAAVTETPDDYIFAGNTDNTRMNEYLSAWEAAEAADEGASAETLFLDQAPAEIDPAALESEMQPEAVVPI